MFAQATFDIGPNVVSVALALITLGTLVANNLTTRRDAKAAESAAHNLTNNGGETALDKLTIGQTAILAELETVNARLDSHDELLTRISKEG